MNLLRFAAGNRDELDGVLLMRGVDLATLPIRRALSVLWAIALEGRDDKERSKMIAQLTELTPRRAQRMRNDFWAGHQEDAALFRRAQQSARAKGSSAEVSMSDAFG